MIPFLKARLAGLERFLKDRLVSWSELSPYHWTCRAKRWLGTQYVKTRTSDFHKDLWGYIILPGLLFLVVALAFAPLWM